jgi:CheY-like chemotaxis protein
MIDERRHDLTVSLPAQVIWLHADSARLEQIVVNLLGNAAKYTEPGGHVWLSVEQRDSECVLRVRDNGVGIDPELLPHVFDLFTQGKRSLARSQGGLGIGLALVKQLVEMHQGQVECRSTVGKGSEFTVVLPVVPVPEVKLSSSVTEPNIPAVRRLRILIVDDNVDTVDSLALLLRALGHDVREAYDGLGVVDSVIDFKPHIILLDIGLPGIDGYELAKRIRERNTLKNIVLVALTGYGHESAIQQSIDSGFDHHMTKPADLDKLNKIFADIATTKQ